MSDDLETLAECSRRFRALSDTGVEPEFQRLLMFTADRCDQQAADLAAKRNRKSLQPSVAGRTLLANPQ